MWHCSALFFLRHFPGLSESTLWKDPLHLLLQPANYNAVIKSTQKQLPSYITVPDKHTATSSCVQLPSQKDERWVWLSLRTGAWGHWKSRMLSDLQFCAKSAHTLHRNGSKALQPHWSYQTRWIQKGVLFVPSPPWNNLIASQLLSLAPESLQRFKAVTKSWNVLVLFNSAYLFCFQHSQHLFLYDNNRPYFFFLVALQSPGEQSLRFYFAW